MGWEHSAWSSPCCCGGTRSSGPSPALSPRDAWPCPCRAAELQRRAMAGICCLVPAGASRPDRVLGCSCVFVVIFYFFFLNKQFLVPSSFVNTAPASTPSLLHKVYGVAFKRKQAWSGGTFPPTSYKAKTKGKWFACGSPGKRCCYPGEAGERHPAVLQQTPLAHLLFLILQGLPRATWRWRVAPRGHGHGGSAPTRGTARSQRVSS